MSKDETKKEIINEGMLNLRVCKWRYRGARSDPAKVFLPPGQAKHPTLLACAIKKKLCFMWEILLRVLRKKMVLKGHGIHFVKNGHINCQNYDQILCMLVVKIHDSEKAEFS